MKNMANMMEFSPLGYLSSCVLMMDGLSILMEEATYEALYATMRPKPFEKNYF